MYFIPMQKFSLFHCFCFFYRALYLTSNPSGGCSKVNKKQHHVQRFNLELNPSDNEDGSQEVEDCMGTEELEGYESEKLILYRNKKKRQATTPNGEEILSNKRSASFKGIRLLSASAPAAVSSQG